MVVSSNIMKKSIHIFILIFLLSSVVEGKEVVILLHGLARSSSSMEKMERQLVVDGYAVANISYPSRNFSIEELSETVREQIRFKDPDVEKIHFVTHSLGGILVRYIQQYFPVERIGRVVMLSPPNQGSEVVDALSGIYLFKAINGPAGEQLGTKNGNLVPSLEKVDFELGIITGDRSINWIQSIFMIPGKDDGKVSIERAKVDGMKAFKVVHATHPFIMKRSSVIRDVIEFLRTGDFTEDKY